MWMDQSMRLLKALDNDSLKASFFSLNIKKTPQDSWNLVKKNKIDDFELLDIHSDCSRNFRKLIHLPELGH